jgi:tetratricopeptide (TPR) repeat protein
LLADDAPAAEAELRLGYERLKGLGETGAALSNVAAVLAQALYLMGRHDEAYQLSGVAKRCAAPGDLSAQVWRGPRAKVLARRGRTGQAAALADEAVELARGTDFLNMQGDALADAADVLRLARCPDEAAIKLRKAIHAYDRKGNRTAARRARGRLAELAELAGPAG